MARTLAPSAGSDEKALSRGGRRKLVVVVVVVVIVIGERQQGEGKEQHGEIAASRRQ